MHAFLAVAKLFVAAAMLNPVYTMQPVVQPVASCIRSFTLRCDRDFYLLSLRFEVYQLRHMGQILYKIISEVDQSAAELLFDLMTLNMCRTWCSACFNLLLLHCRWLRS